MRAAGREVRVLSRSGRPGTLRGDLSTGENLGAAVRGADTIVHCASNPLKPRQTDVAGTERLLQEAARAGVSHVVYISIVGVDRNPFPYYRAKLESERTTERSPVPWTILRASRRNKRLVGVPLPGKAARAVREGAQLCPDKRYGTVRWEEFLGEKIRHRRISGLSGEEI